MTPPAPTSGRGLPNRTSGERDANQPQERDQSESLTPQRDHGGKFRGGGLGSFLRFGYHGSLPAAVAIVLAAGHRPERLVFHEYDITDPFAALRAGELDVMIVKFGRTELDLEYSAVVATDQRVAVLGAHHPLAERASVSVEELADFDGFRRPGTFPASVWNEVVPPRTPSGRPIRRRHELTGAGTMMATVQQSTAVHISLRSLADIAPPSVRVVPVHDLPPAPVRLAWLRGRGHRVRDFVRDAELGR